ncbi:MAG TPA: nucleotidyltransferase family protein [Verrucomicrobiae bacterium]|nr:nucleotidyltransferase family protein [Verrucomicrobiae bacterium]
MRTLDLPVAILSGGLATRLRPVSEKTPKALLPVVGRPFLAHQLDLLRKRGIRDVVLCVGHLGERIREAVPDGRPWGITLRYSFDGPTLLGTGGAVRQALSLLGEKFFVLYGDSYLPTDYGAVARAFARRRRPALMTVFRNEGKWDTSNVVFRNGKIVVYDKRRRTPEMQHIDYGLSVLTPGAFAGLESKTPLDLAEVFQKLVVQGQLAGYEVSERFYEAGSQTGLAELEALLGQRP